MNIKSEFGFVQRRIVRLKIVQMIRKHQILNYKNYVSKHLKSKV